MTPHNEAKIEDISNIVLMPGDPLRAKFLAETYLEDVKQFNTVRNMLGYTGRISGIFRRRRTRRERGRIRVADTPAADGRYYLCFICNFGRLMAYRKRFRQKTRREYARNHRTRGGNPGPELFEPTNAKNAFFGAGHVCAAARQF